MLNAADQHGTEKTILPVVSGWANGFAEQMVPKCAMFRSWIEFKHPGDDLAPWHNE